MKANVKAARRRWTDGAPKISPMKKRPAARRRSKGKRPLVRRNVPVAGPSVPFHGIRPFLTTSEGSLYVALPALSLDALVKRLLALEEDTGKLRRKLVNTIDFVRDYFGDLGL